MATTSASAVIGCRTVVAAHEVMNFFSSIITCETLWQHLLSIYGCRPASWASHCIQNGSFIFLSTTFATDCLRILISPPLFVIFSTRALKIWGFRLVWSFTCMAESLKVFPVLLQNTNTCSHFLQTPGTSRDMEGVVHTLGRSNVTSTSVSLTLFCLSRNSVFKTSFGISKYIVQSGERKGKRPRVTSIDREASIEETLPPS